MADSPNVTRRLLLKGSATAAPAAFLLANPASAQQKPSHDDLAASAPAAGRAAAADYQPSYFTPDEWAFVRAACGRIVPHDMTGPGALDVDVPQYIDQAMQSHYGEAARWYMSGPFVKAAPEFGYQSSLTPRQQYRLGARAVDAYCRQTYGGVFAWLDPAQQDAVLKGMEEGHVTDESFDMKTFFEGFLLKNTIEGYFCDPMYGGNKDMAAWRMIGHPGARGDFQDWVALSDRPYPYGPVSIHGQEG